MEEVISKTLMTPLYPSKLQHPHIYAQVPKNNIGRHLLLERIEETDCIVERLNEIVYILFSVVEVETGTCTRTDS